MTPFGWNGFQGTQFGSVPSMTDWQVGTPTDVVDDVERALQTLDHEVVERRLALASLLEYWAETS